MIQWLYHSAFLIVLSVRLAHPSKSLMLQASLTYMCSSSLGPFPGLAALTSGISSFFFSPFHWGWSSFFSPAFTFFFPPLLLTLSQVCYCRLPLLLVLMSTCPRTRGWQDTYWWGRQEQSCSSNPELWSICKREGISFSARVDKCSLTYFLVHCSLLCFLYLPLLSPLSRAVGAMVHGLQLWEAHHPYPGT